MSPADKLAATKRPKAQAKPGKGGNRRKHPWTCKARELRQSKRLSMRDVADALNLSVAGYYEIEHGGDPLLTTARDIANFFGTTTDELWKRRTV